MTFLTSTDIKESLISVWQNLILILYIILLKCETTVLTFSVMVNVRPEDVARSVVVLLKTQVLLKHLFLN